jgi:hypothetical protein
MSNFELYGARSHDAIAERDGVNRKALCIGINAYPTSPLTGCVADARAWERSLTRVGFQVQLLLDHQATSSRILDTCASLINSARAGDVIAIQFSGHGTSVPRSSGDETTDEALCAYNFNSGGLIVDDDLARLCDRIPTGVNVTFFMDCCHSGTNTRLFRPSDERSRSDERVRFLPPTPEMIEAYWRERQYRGAARASRSPYANRSEVLFAACKDTQKSYETGGHGNFTRHAVATLDRGISGMTNGAFIDRVRGALHDPRQTPELWSDRQFWDAGLLAPRSSSAGAGPAAPPPAGGGGGPSPPPAGGGAATDKLDSLIQQLDDWLKKNRT